MTPALRKFSPPLLLLIAAGCASAPVPPPPTLVAEILSSPAGLEMEFSGRIVGTTPLELQLDSLDKALEVSPTQTLPPIVERRVRVLSPDRVQILVRVGDEPSDVAKALGLTRVVVFDYGALTTFDTDKYELKPDLLPVLKNQAELLDSHFSALDVYVCGHTDNSGEQDYNQLLSLKRAESVAAYLTEQGIPSDRLRIQGFGPDYPVADNSTRDGKALNRRTEIILPD